MATSSPSSKSAVRDNIPKFLESRHFVDLILKVVLTILLTAVLVVILVPSYWMFMTSFKKIGTELTRPIEWLPREWLWRNYVDVLEYFPYFQYLRNTLILTVSNVIATVISSSLVAYSLSRLRWQGRDAVFGICLATMMLPGIVTMIPTFIIFRKLGWWNTFLPLIVPTWFGGGAFNIFLLRQFFMTLPMDLDEAARMDGASGLTIWSKIILPLSKPALVTVAIFSFLGNWNNFMGPLLYLNDRKLFPLSVGLNMLNASYMGSGWGQPLVAYVMAGSIMTISPVLVVFFLAQRYFVQGIVMTGMAGR